MADSALLDEADLLVGIYDDELTYGMQSSQIN